MLLETRWNVCVCSKVDLHFAEEVHLSSDKGGKRGKVNYREERLYNGSCSTYHHYNE